MKILKLLWKLFEWIMDNLTVLVLLGCGFLLVYGVGAPASSEKRDGLILVALAVIILDQERSARREKRKELERQRERSK